MDAETRARASGRHCGLTQKVPVIEVGKELGTVIKQSDELGNLRQEEVRNGVCTATAGSQVGWVKTLISCTTC